MSSPPPQTAPIWALRRTFTVHAPSERGRGRIAKREGSPWGLQADKQVPPLPEPANEDKPATREATTKALFRRSALKLARSASMRLPKRNFSLESSNGNSPPGKAKKTEVEVEVEGARVAAQGDGHDRDGERGEQEVKGKGKQTAENNSPGSDRVERERVPENNAASSSSPPNIPPTTPPARPRPQSALLSRTPLHEGKIRERNLRVKFDCPAEPAPTFTPTPPTTPYLVADGLTLRPVAPESPESPRNVPQSPESRRKVHHT